MRSQGSGSREGSKIGHFGVSRPWIWGSRGPVSWATRQEGPYFGPFLDLPRDMFSLYIRDLGPGRSLIEGTTYGFTYYIPSRARVIGISC